MLVIRESFHFKPGTLTAHNLWFSLFSGLSLLLFGGRLYALARLSIQDARYSHILLIPVMSGLLLYLDRRRIFTRASYSPLRSVPLIVVGAGLFCFAQTWPSAVNSNDRLSAVVLALILIWTGGFLLCYGMEAFLAAIFPLAFFLLMIPIPTFVLDKITLALQEGSAVMTYALYRLSGIPVLWQHFKFLLPGVEIQIAEECSGIRSSMALFITSILAGHVFLHSNWRRVFFSLLTIPVVVFKNAVRIVTISSLGVYVDPGFLHGKLHRYGGLPFSLVSLAILVPLLLRFQKGEPISKQTTVATEVHSPVAIDSNSPVMNSAFD